MKRIIYLMIVLIRYPVEHHKPCRAIQSQYGIMCECSEDYCDTLFIPESYNSTQFVIVTSSKGGQRFNYKYGSFAAEFKSRRLMNTLSIDQTTTYSQSKIIGFGGGWTDAVTYVLNRFSPELRAKFYRSYFSSDVGLGYNMIRIPIGGTEFSLSPWTNDMSSKPDPTMSHFTALDPRDIDQNKQLKEMQRITNNSNIKFIAAAWSPPLWMKSMHEWYGAVTNQVKPQYYQALATYHARWLNLTEADGIPIWAMSTGNEPFYAKYYPCEAEGNSWNASNQADWIVDYFVPAIKRTGFDIKIHIFDDMRDIAEDYLKNMTDQRSNIMDYADIIAIHPFLDGTTSPSILDTIHQKYNKQIVYTEMSFGAFDNPTGVTNGSWSRAEELITILMESLGHNVAGYIDWNIILDANGGPSYVNASYDAFIHASTDFKVFYKQPVYYAMAHFAKFIPRDSLRINTKFHGPGKSLVQTLAYLRPDGKISIILYNNDTNTLTFTLKDPFKGQTHISLEPKSLNTIVYSTT